MTEINLVILVCFSIAVFIYCVFLTLAMQGISHLSRRESIAPPDEQMIAAIIPVMNENVDMLIKTLYSKVSEILIVIDKEDRVIEFKDTKIRVIYNEGRGKRAAIETGLRHVDSNRVLLVDADMDVPELVSLNKLGRVVSFPVIEKGGPLKFPYLESLAIAGISQGLLAFGIRTTISGAMLLVEKDYLSEFVATYKSRREAGFDMAFLKYAKGNVVPAGLDSAVYTSAKTIISEYLIQRMRWVGNARNSSTLAAKVMGLNLLILYGLFLTGLFMDQVILPMIALYSIKCVFDISLLFLVATRVGRIPSIWLIIRMEIIYPFYALIVPILGYIVSPDWRGRKD